MDGISHKVEKKTIVTKQGLYAPLSSSGRIVVDGFLVSSYAHAGHELAHIAHIPLIWKTAVWPDS